MTTLLVTLLVLISLGLIVAVPVALATPGEWEGAKNNFNNAFAAWVGLVLVIAAVDGVSSSI
jgi:photosystem II core protein PsbZ